MSSSNFQPEELPLTGPSLAASGQTAQIAQTSNAPDLYVVPAKFRSLENMHILFWLVKDICWCLGFEPLGVFMIFPTLTAAIYITWRNRRMPAELAHNAAMTLWIIANSMWMIFEFMENDDTLKYYCLIPFFCGLAILVYYYLVYRLLLKRKAFTPPS